MRLSFGWTWSKRCTSFLKAGPWLKWPGWPTWAAWPKRISWPGTGLLQRWRRRSGAALGARRAPAAAAFGLLGRSAARDEFALPATNVQWGEYVEAARREWLGYRAYFDCVDDPELIDHAIYSIQAAERKYMYLLRRARMAGVDLTAPVGPDGAERDGGPVEAASKEGRAR